LSGIRHRVVLTGASGTLGRNLLELIGSRADVQVLTLLRPESRMLPTWVSVESVRVDLLDRAAVRSVVTAFQPTCIVHCAATGMEFPRTEWFDLIRFNVDLTVNLCECAATIPDCHFIFVSTGLAYRQKAGDRPFVEDDPLDTQHPYGASKAAADLLVRSAAAEFGVPLTVLRPFSFTGLGDDRRRLFSVVLRAASERTPIGLSAGTQVRDHCSARDIAAGIVLAMEAERQWWRTSNLISNLYSVPVSRGGLIRHSSWRTLAARCAVLGGLRDTIWRTPSGNSPVSRFRRFPSANRERWRDADCRRATDRRPSRV